MATNLFFSRDTKVYIELFNSSGASTGVFEVPVLDGFSFSQAQNSTEVTLAEMENSAGVSKRGRRVFNDSLAPVEWSFSTYVRPFESVGEDVAGNADKRSGATGHTQQISIISINTDEGVLEPLGVGEITIEVRY